MATLERRLEALESKGGDTVVLICYEWMSPDDRRPRYAEIHGEKVYRHEDETAEAFFSRARALVFAGQRSTRAVVFLDPLDLAA